MDAEDIGPPESTYRLHWLQWLQGLQCLQLLHPPQRLQCLQRHPRFQFLQNRQWLSQGLYYLKGNVIKKQEPISSISPSTMSVLEVLTLHRSMHSGDYSDLVIKCGGHEFKVHKVIVCSQSEVFAAAMRFEGKVPTSNHHAEKHPTAFFNR